MEVRGAAFRVGAKGGREEGRRCIKGDGFAGKTSCFWMNQLYTA